MVLVWAGNQQLALDPAHFLAKLVVRAMGLVIWYFVEKYFCEYTTVPFNLFVNRTTLIGYFGTFLRGISALALFYYW